MKKFQPLGGGGPRKGPPTKRLGTCGRPLILSDQERFRRDSCSQGDGNDDMAVVRAPLVPGLLTTAPVSLKVRQKFRPLGVGGRRANELLKKSCLGPRRVAPGKALVSKFLSGRDFTPGEIQVPTDMDLSLMEDLSDAEAMDEEEPPPKYRPLTGVPSFAFSRGRRVDAARPLFDRAGEHEPLVLCEGEGDTPDVEVPPLLCQWLRPHQYVTASKINPHDTIDATPYHTGARASPSSSSASTA